MQLMSNGRVRRTDIEWRVILARWKKSGLSPVEFCKKQDIRLLITGPILIAISPEMIVVELRDHLMRDVGVENQCSIHDSLGRFLHELRESDRHPCGNRSPSWCATDWRH